MKCCQYNAGQLRTTCQFQRKTRVPDGKGGWAETWANLAGAATRGHFKALSGSERFSSQRAEATTRNRLVVRYFAGLTDEDRVVVGGRRYDVTFINNVELRNLWMEIDLSGGVPT